MLGGGPAGSSAAILLASWGHRVRVVTRRHGELRLAVSVPPSTRKLFDAVGVSAAVETARFIRSTGNTVWWGSDHPRVEPFADGARGWQVATTELEDLLLDEAARAGATIERRVIGEPDLATGAWPFLIDCSGRSGLLARAKNVRKYDDGPRTVALVGEWRRDDDWRVPEASHTLVESYESGWAWSVPTGTYTRHVAVMVDPKRSGLSRTGSGLDVYLGEIEKTPILRSLLEGAQFAGGPWGWDASSYHARTYAGENWLLAGDAGWFVDPLSSAGVKKALASGWLAAIVANTWIGRPELRAHAIGFFDDRERAIERQFSLMSRKFLAEAAPSHPYAFWNDRSEVGGEDDLSSDNRSKTEAAYEALRVADALRLVRGRAISIEPRPMIRGREIVLDAHLVTALQPAGVRYVDDVDMVALIELAPLCAQVPDLFEAYRKKVGPAPFPSVLKALATAVARGWLVAE